MKKVKYHLRFQVLPGPREINDADILAAFCKKHKIEEVVLFVAGEEWNTGLLSKKDEDIWFYSLSNTKRVIEDKGITVSLNPWFTVLHGDRGSRFPEGYDFHPMVSPLGEKSRACASFADKNWQRYIKNFYGRFASLGFRVIWIEDDFRYHNHTPLTWGGGFEEEVCRIFSKKIGKDVAREEILANILKPGKPHPWRSIWMETWRQLQIDIASAIASSVSLNSSENTKLGLMSSSPFIHSIEGRRWNLLFESLSIGEAFAHRPHFADYAETPGKNRVRCIHWLDLQKQLRPNVCEVAPEIENFPFTQWTKSDTSTWADMAIALFMGSDSLLLDLFPFTANRADEEPEIGRLLDRSYDSLSWITDNFSNEFNLEGVGIPWKENASELVHTEKGESLEELDVAVQPAWNFLLSYGIPCCTGIRGINAIFGNSAWIFTDKEIEGMLAGGLLIDGISAQILIKRGFQRYLGIEYLKTLKRDESTYGIEVVRHPGTGVREGFYMSVNNLSRLPVIEPVKEASCWTEIITRDNKRVGAGITLYKNSLGGNVAVIAAENPSVLYLSFHRQLITLNLIKHIAGDGLTFPLVKGSPYQLPMHFKGFGEDILVVHNATIDRADIVIESAREAVDAKLLKPLEEPEDIKLESFKKDGFYILKPSLQLPPMSFISIKF